GSVHMLSPVPGSRTQEKNAEGGHTHPDPAPFFPFGLLRRNRRSAGPFLRRKCLSLRLDDRIRSAPETPSLLGDGRGPGRDGRARLLAHCPFPTGDRIHL